jgi:putative transposase
MSLQGSLSIERMCQMVPVSRRSFYRSLKEQQPVEEEMEVRSAIQQIALEHRRRYGYRRITAELHRRGMQINHSIDPLVHAFCGARIRELGGSA